MTEMRLNWSGPIGPDDIPAPRTELRDVTSANPVTAIGTGRTKQRSVP